MNKNLTPFEEIRRKRAKKKLLKKTVSISLLSLVLMFVFYAYKNNYYVKFINSIDGIFTVLKKGSGYPIEINATAIKSKSKIGNELLILDEDIVYIFNRYGYKTLYAKHGLNNPRVISNNNKSVIFEQLGKKLQIYSKTYKLFEKELNTPIYNMAISNSGKIAVIRGSNRFLSTIEIWNELYENIFTWNSAEKYVTSVAFSPNNKDFVAAAIETQGVEYISTINFFNINRDEKIAVAELKNEMIISIKYENNNVYVISDKNAYIFNNKAKLKYQYAYNGKVLNTYNNDLHKYMVLIFDNYNWLENNNLVVLDYMAKPIGECKVKGKIKDIDSIDRRICLLTDESVKVFDLTAKMIGTYNVSNDINNIICTPNRLYKLNISEIDIVK